MSFPRACQPCRAAKARCDLISPACTRCVARGLQCSGISRDTSLGFVFRNENETARRNSRRARGETRKVRVVPISFGEGSSQDQTVRASTTAPDPFLRQFYSWLNDHALAEAPEQLRRDVETRAVERFFVNWTLHPDNDGVSPGHMSDLPFLYSNSPPDSVLSFAVRAVAFADMHHYRAGDIPFSAMALQHYGTALHRLRSITQNEQWLSDDGVLAALLLIDNFESVYLARTEPLGPHSTAIVHALHARGNGQFYNRSDFRLWRAAYHRVQARQILLREEPDAQQISWLSKLNTQNIPLRITADVQQMSILAAAARRMTEDDRSSQLFLPERITQAKDLTLSILDLTNSIQTWMSEVNEVWGPKLLDPRNIAQSAQDISSTLPIPCFDCPIVLDYHDIWLSYTWNMHAAAQIILRESLIEVTQQLLTLEGREPTVDESRLIYGQKNAVKNLSCMIIRSFPQLMGFAIRGSREPCPVPNGMMIGRFFSLFSMSVVQGARFAPDEYKTTASDVIGWIYSSHGLDSTTKSRGS